MSIARRDIFKAAGAMAALGVAGGVYACSPADPIDDLPQNYFGLIASRKYDEAQKLLSNSVRLSIVAVGSQNLFTGKKNITNRISNLFHTEGFKMVGDTGEYAPGGIYWRQVGPWLCSDMYKGDLLSFNHCGDDKFNEEVLNVFVSSQSDDKTIDQILLLHNRNLVIDDFELYRTF